LHVHNDRLIAERHIVVENHLLSYGRDFADIGERFVCCLREVDNVSFKKNWTKWREKDKMGEGHDMR
jgi:hypothetical protein